MSEPSQIAKDAAEGFNTAKPVTWTTWDSFAGRQIAHSKQPSLAAWIQLALDHASADKDKRIAELEESFDMSKEARRAWLGTFDNYKNRLTEARRLIERIGSVGADSVEYIEAAKKWLEGTP